MEEQIEQKLVSLAQQGDLQAFEQLITSYEKKIYTICLRMLGNEQDAYDAAQEVCVKIWRQLKNFEGNSKLSTWIYRVTTNQCLDYLRKFKNKNKDEISLFQTSHTTQEEWMIDVPSKELTTEEQMDQKVLSEVIQEGMNELKAEYKEIIVLRDVMGHSYDEISTILQVSVGTVKSRLSRARNALKKVLMQNKEPYCSFFRHINKKEGAL
ncbi:MAG: RNA polymerase sigma factor [Cellulosilyticaceae bacterium]